jgi:hypothetical protein
LAIRISVVQHEGVPVVKATPADLYLGDR